MIGWVLLGSALAQDPVDVERPVVDVEPTSVSVTPEVTVAPQDPAPSPAPAGKPPYDKNVSITFSPIHLRYPIVELTGEFRIVDRASAAVILGAGSFLGYTALEFGAQGIGYPLGSFDHGLQLGGEILATRVSSQDVSATGVAIGPFAGYKIAARFGLTFNAQVGAAYYLASASSGNVTLGSQQFAALVNLNVGWSF